MKYTLNTLNTLNPLNYFNKFKEFDKVTELRLINAFIVAIGIALLTPILISLKGLYLAAYIISMFAILQSLAVKTNNWVVSHITIENMFRLSILIHLTFVLISCIYFWSPFYMVIAESILGILEVSLFSSFSISLNTYLTEEYPQDMSKFQILRNGIWADGYLIGLGSITLITYFSTIGAGVLAFIIFNTIFSIWLFTKWNFYKDNKYCTTLHHKQKNNINTKK
jgi:MFS family permease